MHSCRRALAGPRDVLANKVALRVGSNDHTLRSMLEIVSGNSIELTLPKRNQNGNSISFRNSENREVS